MKKHQWIFIITLLILFILSISSTAEAFPPLPSSFWGSAKLNSTDLPKGTFLKAAIDGAEYAVSIVEIVGGDSLYSLDIPGDDAATTGIIEGGTTGKQILFLLGSTVANETGTWTSGTNQNLDLTFTSLAPPILPSSFYGTVKINGQNPSDGTLISAVINGVTYNSSQVALYLGQAVYSLNVPGDDPATPLTIEGGTAGDKIQFLIGEILADQPGTWLSESNTELNLTGTAPVIEKRYYFPAIYQ